MKTGCVALLLTLMASGAIAQTNAFSGAVAGLEHEIDIATDELNRTRSRIEKERGRLAARQMKLQEKLRERRAELQELRQANVATAERRRKQEQNFAKLSHEAESIHNRLVECRRNLAVNLSAPLLELYHSRLEQCDGLLNAKQAGQTEATRALLPLVCEVVSNGVGGIRFKGSALNSAGVEEAGQYAIAGPVAFFASKDGAGLVTERAGHLIPSYISGSAREAAAVRRLIAGKDTRVPIDITGGMASLVERDRASFKDSVRQGGVVMIPILLIGLLAVLLSIMKFFEMRRMRSALPPDIAAVADAVIGKDEHRAESLIAKLPPLTAELLRLAIDHRNAPRELSEEILHEHILAQMPRLERHLGALAVMGAVAPLLGLLGTVTGMMHTFALITIFGAGDARLLSGGISEALITTKFGLAIAIPILLAHAFFARWVRTTVANLENSAVLFMNRLYDEPNAKK